MGFEEGTWGCRHKSSDNTETTEMEEVRQQWEIKKEEERKGK